MISESRKTHIPSFSLYTPEPRSASSAGCITDAGVIAWAMERPPSAGARRGGRGGGGAELPVLGQEILGRPAGAEFVGRLVDPGRHRPVAVGRGRRGAPLQPGVVPGIPLRLPPPDPAADEVEQEQELGREEEERRDRDEPVEPLQRVHEKGDKAGGTQPPPRA